PIEHGHATSYTTFTQHHEQQQKHIQTLVKATLPVAVHTQLGGYHSLPVVHAAPVVLKSAPHVEEHYAYPKYQFKYGVEDHHTGDIKQQQEVRDGDVVKGEYSLHEPDGTILTVKYVADKHSGFNAVVHRQGHASHPQHVAKAVVAVPLHHR
ncbi:Chitin bind 4 domain containing protein, partial [Asbolus verrucosus]